MNKIKMLTLMLFIVLSIIGGAHAAFSDEILSNVTVGAGTLNVEITRADFPNQGHPSIPYITGGIKPSLDNKKVTFWVNNLYPTNKISQLHYQLKLKNTGSIPVKLNKNNGVTFRIDKGPPEVWNHLWGEIHLTIYNNKNEQVGETKNIGPFHFRNIGGIIEDLMLDVELPTDWSAHYHVLIWLDPNVCGESQAKSIEYTIVFNWIQANM